MSSFIQEPIHISTTVSRTSGLSCFPWPASDATWLFNCPSMSIKALCKAPSQHQCLQQRYRFTQHFLRWSSRLIHELVSATEFPCQWHLSYLSECLSIIFRMNDCWAGFLGDTPSLEYNLPCQLSVQKPLSFSSTLQISDRVIGQQKM